MSSDPAVLIGRFQPPHRAHLALMREALAAAPELVIVLGSARSARTVRNPLSDAERTELIRTMLAGEGLDPGRVRFQPVPDVYYNLPLWVDLVRQAVNSPRAALHGFEKDASSFYLRLFPQWTAHPPGFQSGLDATDVRGDMYEDRWDQVGQAVTPGVLDRLRAFAHTPSFRELQADREAIRLLAAAGPVRSQAVLLVSGGQMLLQARPSRPGLGLLSLPEAPTGKQAIGQVLSDVPADLTPLAGRMLDHPHRLPGLNWQTQVTLYRLPTALPPLAGAEWVSLDMVHSSPERFFADHAQGIRALLEGWPE